MGRRFDPHWQDGAWWHALPKRDRRGAGASRLTNTLAGAAVADMMDMFSQADGRSDGQKHAETQDGSLAASSTPRRTRRRSPTTTPDEGAGHPADLWNAPPPSVLDVEFDADEHPTPGVTDAAPSTEAAPPPDMFSRRQVQVIVAREVARVRAGAQVQVNAARAEAIAEMAGLGGTVVGLPEGVQLVSVHTAGASARAMGWPIMAGVVAVGSGVCVFLGLSTISLEWFGAAFALPVAGLAAGILAEGYCRVRSWAPVVQAGGGYRIRADGARAEVLCRSWKGASEWRPVSDFVVVQNGSDAEWGSEWDD